MSESNFICDRCRAVCQGEEPADELQEAVRLASERVAGIDLSKLITGILCDTCWIDLGFAEEPNDE